MVAELRSRNNPLSSSSLPSSPIKINNNNVKDLKTTTTTTSPSKKHDKKNRIDKGRKRSGLEIPRKLLHSSISIASVTIYLLKPNLNLVSGIMMIFLIIVVSADFLRFRNERFEKFYESKLGLFMRESERTEVNGVIYYLGGVLICMTFYPRDLACLSIIILSLCDTAASVVGRLFGKFTPRLPFSGSLFGANKSLAGSIGGVITGCLASYIFWTRIATGGDLQDCSWIPARSSSIANIATLKNSNPPFWFNYRLPNPNSTLSLWALVLSNGAVAGLAEAIDVFGLDDNLSLPVLFGLFAHSLMWFLG